MPPRHDLSQLAGSSSHTSTTLRLNCLIKGEDIVFPVTVVRDDEISDLKKVIQHEGGPLKDVHPYYLELWKPKDSNPIAAKPQTTLAERIGLLGHDLSKFADKLEAVDSAFSIFPTQPPRDRIHIIVKVPAVATISPSSSNEFKISSVPHISDYWSPRHDTVHRLYHVLLQKRLVHVRGTPGSGKTTLMHLLCAFVRKHNPQAFVVVQTSWPPTTASGLTLDERLRVVDPTYPRNDGLSFLLFDEGQTSYTDHSLWNDFFKGVCDGSYSCYRVILFCSYGSPSSRPVPRHVLTPLVLENSARISLRPRGGLEGSIGILLNRAEFDEVASRFEGKLNLHPALLDVIFEWTIGHVGAVVKLLRVISYQRDRWAPFTLESFLKKNPTHILVQNLSGEAFGRGLPKATELLAWPDVAALFRKLLQNGAIEKIDKNEDEDEDEEDKAIRKCHRHGWIHADPTADEVIVRYLFPSPLHRLCVSWMLKPTDDMPEFDSLFDLAIDVISKFKPSQLKVSARRVSPGPTDRLPEAQYQNEFYRSVFSVTFGNVRISPEFASERRALVAGRIDFFIPKSKWGIEITRDGQRLTEHSSRFAGSGAYGSWLTSGDMTNYILLDCRTTIPRKAHPDIPNLFHVVFQHDYQQVVVYTNEVMLVKGPIVLLENH